MTVAAKQSLTADSPQEYSENTDGQVESQVFRSRGQKESIFNSAVDELRAKFYSYTIFEMFSQWLMSAQFLSCVAITSK